MAKCTLEMVGPLSAIQCDMVYHELTVEAASAGPNGHLMVTIGGTPALLKRYVDEVYEADEGTYEIVE
jgi:hypothetical protein